MNENEFESPKESPEERAEYFANVFEYAATPETGRVYLTRTASEILELILPYGFDQERDYGLDELRAIVDAIFLTSGSGDLDYRQTLKIKMDILTLLEDVFLARISISAAAKKQAVLRATAFQRIKRVTARSAYVVASDTHHAQIEDLMQYAESDAHQHQATKHLGQLGTKLSAEAIQGSEPPRSESNGHL